MSTALAEHQIRRLVLYVHTVRLSTVCAAQVSGRVQPVPENPSGDAWWTATRTTISGCRGSVATATRWRSHAEAEADLLSLGVG